MEQLTKQDAATDSGSIESNDENDEDDGIADVFNNERKYVTAKAQASSSLTSGVISPSVHLRLKRQFSPPN